MEFGDRFQLINVARPSPQMMQSYVRGCEADHVRLHRQPRYLFCRDTAETDTGTRDLARASTRLSSCYIGRRDDRERDRLGLAGASGFRAAAKCLAMKSTERITARRRERKNS